MGKSGLMKVVLISTILVGFLLLIVSANEKTLKEIASTEIEIEEIEVNFLRKAVNFLWKSGQNTYEHVWPVSLNRMFFLVSNNFVFLDHQFDLIWELI